MSLRAIYHCFYCFTYLYFFNCLEVVEKAAETTVEAVEKVSEVTEKIASEIADELPDGGRLKEQALQIEKICGTLDNDAKTAEAFIDKVCALELLPFQKSIREFRIMSLLDMNKLALILPKIWGKGFYSYG